MQEKWKIDLKLSKKVEFILMDHTLAASRIHDANAQNSLASTDTLTLLVSIPVQNGKEKLLDVEKSHDVLIYGTDRVYALRVKACRELQGDLPLYRLSIQAFLGEIQRRQNVRIAVSLPVKFAELQPGLKHSNTSLLGNMPSDEGWIADLSAGGIRLITEANMTRGQTLLMNFDLENETLKVLGVIRHKTRREPGVSKEYSYGIQFEDLSVRIEDRMVRFIFSKLRQNRRLEL